MDFVRIRQIAITAIFSDDVLFEKLVLKGGNALTLIYGLTLRTSLDLDFSMQEDFDDVTDAGKRFFRALGERFDAAGYVVFEPKLEAKPALKGHDEKPWWGGYQLSFKLIDRKKFEELKARPGKLRVNAIAIASTQERAFTIDVSKCEYTEGKVERELDDYVINVYTPEMIVIEKLRAICQQMTEYEHTSNKRGRARDFYDIYHVVTARSIEISSPENLDLARHIFAAKQVPLALLQNVERERQFHQLDWPAVVSTTSGRLEPFDFYFDFVLRQIKDLKPYWVK